MDHKIKGDMMFQVLKNVIIEENKELLKIIARHHNLNYVDLEKKYLKPEYYLPLVVKDEQRHQ
jgi:hypothetical protein